VNFFDPSAAPSELQLEHMSADHARCSESFDTRPRNAALDSDKGLAVQLGGCAASSSAVLTALPEEISNEFCHHS